MTYRRFLENAIFWGVLGGVIGYQKGASLLLVLSIGGLEIQNGLRFFICLLCREEKFARILDAKWAYVFDKTAKKLDEGFLYYSSQKEYIKERFEKNPEDWMIPVYERAMTSRFRELKNTLKKANDEERENLLYWLNELQETRQAPIASELKKLLMDEQMYLEEVIEDFKARMNFLSYDLYRTTEPTTGQTEALSTYRKRALINVK